MNTEMNFQYFARFEHFRTFSKGDSDIRNTGFTVIVRHTVNKRRDRSVIVSSPVTFKYFIDVAIIIIEILQFQVIQRDILIRSICHHNPS
ncbi:hypothetical protein SDC9_119971 [bioreactor metagenome]|uniref:Uncharacterized protein n=1 Tax=bioreactor metagenome TaxID=1076179 RepID=A0A645C613_9ZZZZ